MEFETIKDELLATIDSSLKYSQSLDTNAEFEIYLVYLNKSEVNINQGMVEAADGILAGNAVRVVTGFERQKKVAFSAGSGIDTDSVKKNLREALAININLNITDPRFFDFCDPKQPGHEGLLNDEILTLGTADLVPGNMDLIKECAAVDSRIRRVSSSSTVIWGGFAIGNTRGIQQASRTTRNTFSVDCTAIGENDERKEGFIYETERSRLVDIQGMGKKAGNRAIGQLGGINLDKTVVLPTIWDPNAAASYIRSGLGQSANGASVVEGLSPLADKIGEKIANPIFSLVDDGQKPNGISTHAIDREGYPQQKNIIIEDGVLKSFLFNSYYGNIFGTESTGNCTRSSNLPYEGTPGIQGLNFETSVGIKSEDTLVHSIDRRGILIREMPMGMFHSNVSTGEFSVVANESYLIENGTIQGPIRATSVAGNFYDGLKNIRELADNKRKTPYGVETPSILFDGFSIVA
ncbi:MAG: TldD/PmbA family protein [Candidatus Heimdallarchaeota archaeon]